VNFFTSIRSSVRIIITDPIVVWDMGRKLRKNTLSVSFLHSLLRSSICLESREAWKMDLEDMIAHQLDQAT
jgi:hypothetical protein